MNLEMRISVDSKPIITFLDADPSNEGERAFTPLMIGSADKPEPMELFSCARDVVSKYGTDFKDRLALYAALEVLRIRPFLYLILVDDPYAFLKSGMKSIEAHPHAADIIAAAARLEEPRTVERAQH